MVRRKATPKRKAPAPPQQRRVAFQTLSPVAAAAAKPQPRRVAFQTLSPVAAAAAKPQPRYHQSTTFAPPRKRYSNLTSEPTWMNMMSSIRTKYGIPRKLKRKKKKKDKKKKKPTKAEKKAYQATLRNMTLKQKRQNRTGAMSMTLIEVVRAFPGAAHKLQVYPNRSSLNSLVSRIPGAKKKVGTFL